MHTYNTSKLSIPLSNYLDITRSGLAGPAQVLRGSGAQAQAGAAAGAGRGWRGGAARVQGAGGHWP
jgi:hypothetical protein